MIQIRAIAPPRVPFPSRVTALADLQNPLLGPDGATAVFGPQKGMTPERHPILEAGLATLASVARGSLGVDLAAVPGSGAAGGLGSGVLAFLRGEIRPGFAYLSDLIGLEARIEQADWVVTGEGRLDRQTLFGKAPAGVAELARKHRIPVAAIGGSIEDEARDALSSRFDLMLSLVDEATSPAEAVADAARILESRGRQLAHLLSSPGAPKETG
jgi:glycerate kinase